MSECDSYDELFVQACDSVRALDESDLELQPAQIEKRWENIVKQTKRCKALRTSAGAVWQNGTPRIIFFNRLSL